MSDDPRKWGAIIEDMKALWDLPDELEARLIAASLLVEALRRFQYNEEVSCGTRKRVERLLYAYDELIDGVKHVDPRWEQQS